MQPTHDDTGPRATLWLLRASTTLITLAILAQPVFAGGYLAGGFNLLSTHATTASVVMALALAQIVLALCYWLAGRGSVYPLPLAVVMFMAAGLQTGMGYSRTLAVHIPLGVLIVLLAVGMCVLVFRRSARVGRPRRAETLEAHV